MKQHPGLLPANPASLVDLPRGDRPKPLVWTDERVRARQMNLDARLKQARARANGKRVSPPGIWVSAPRPRSWWLEARGQFEELSISAKRAKAFSQWCGGPVRGPALAGSVVRSGGA